MTKPHLQIFTLHSMQDAAFWRDMLTKETPDVNTATLQTELFSFGLSVLSPESAVYEIARRTQDAQGLILWYYLKRPLPPSVGEALLFAKHAGLPLLLVVLIHDPPHQTSAIEEQESKLREYLAGLGFAANEIPLLSFSSFTLQAPPAELCEALELAAQHHIMPRWTPLRDRPLRALVLDLQPDNWLSLAVLQGTLHPGQALVPFGAPATKALRCSPFTTKEKNYSLSAPKNQAFCQPETTNGIHREQLLGSPGFLQESRQLYAQLYSLPAQSGTLYAPPQQEKTIDLHRLFSCGNSMIEASEGKARMFLFPPTQYLVPGSQVTALLTFPRSEGFVGGLRIRNFAKGAPGVAPSFLVGDGFRWECGAMSGLGVVTKLIRD